MPDLEASSSSAVLVERNGQFFLYEPRLGVIASDQSIDRAYEKFVGAKRDLMAELARAGLTLGQGAAASTAWSGTPAPVVLAGRPMADELRQFLAKTVIVLVIIAACAGVVTIGVGRTISNLTAALAPLEGIGRISLDDVAGKAQAIATDARDLPADRKEVLRRSIGELSRELGPLLDAWRNPPPANPPRQ
jgi:hypothetical protein